LQSYEREKNPFIKITMEAIIDQEIMKYTIPIDVQHQMRTKE